jgi:hypothetical protein
VNNSLPRLIDGMVATLRKEVIPHTEGDFARGQAFGVIYMLESLKRRASWSNEFLVEQLRALEQASNDLSDLAAELLGAPLPDIRAPAQAPSATELEALRNEGDTCISKLVDWLADHRATLPVDAVARAEAKIDHYLNRQSKWELSTSAKPMFVEISSGRERSA